MIESKCLLNALCKRGDDEFANSVEQLLHDKLPQYLLQTLFNMKFHVLLKTFANISQEIEFQNKLYNHLKP